jgi:hypothetical protein
MPECSKANDANFFDRLSQNRTNYEAHGVESQVEHIESYSSRVTNYNFNGPLAS